MLSIIATNNQVFYTHSYKSNTNTNTKYTNLVHWTQQTSPKSFNTNNDKENQMVILIENSIILALIQQEIHQHQHLVHIIQTMTMTFVLFEIRIILFGIVFYVFDDLKSELEFEFQNEILNKYELLDSTHCPPVTSIVFNGTDRIIGNNVLRFVFSNANNNMINEIHNEICNGMYL